MHTTPAAGSARPPGPTGLGTSAARAFRRDDAAADDGALPRFSIPWPPRLNPEVERMRQHSLDWARWSGIVTSDEEVARLDEPRFDRLAGYAHPDARGLRAELVGDWMIWFFPFDDWFDGPLGEEPAAVREVIDPMIGYAYGDHGALPVDAKPLIRAFADLCRRSRMGMSPTWQTRFAEDLAKYLFSYTLEAAIRRAGPERDMEHLLEVRRDAIGIRPSLTFGETAEDHELAFPLVLSETFHQLRKICADTVVVQNDAYSLGKDLRNGEQSNQAVALIRDHGMTPAQAIRHLDLAHDRLIEQYLDLEAHALTMPRRYALPEQAPHVLRYLTTLRCWISGNNAWSQETRRYKNSIRRP